MTKAMANMKSLPVRADYLEQSGIMHYGKIPKKTVEYIFNMIKWEGKIQWVPINNHLQMYKE